MDEGKFINLQCQMRQNQQDLHDYLRDLDTWSEEIKKEDDSLKKMPPSVIFSYAHKV